MSDVKPYPVPLEYDADTGEVSHRGAAVARVYDVDDFPCLDEHGADGGAIQLEIDATGNALVERYNAHETLLAERNKLQAFKDYCHARLDAAGVPADPESAHKAEGCRIGGRLDVLIGGRDALLAACELWDHGFTEGEQFTPEQFRAWVNANRAAARAAIALATKGAVTA